MQSQHVEILILPALVCVGSSNAIACPTPSTRLRTLPECAPARRSCIPPEHERRPLCRRDRGIRAPRCMVAPRRLPAGRWPPMASRPLYSARAAASRRTRSAEQNVHTCMYVTPHTHVDAYVCMLARIGSGKLYAYLTRACAEVCPACIIDCSHNRASPRESRCGTCECSSHGHGPFSTRAIAHLWYSYMGKINSTLGVRFIGVGSER